MKYKFWTKEFWNGNDQTEYKRGYFDALQNNGGDIPVQTYGIATANTPSLAMKVSTVLRCVDILASSIASLPLDVKVKRNGVFQVYTSGTLPYLLSCQANSRHTAYELLQNAVIQMVMQGNAYILPQYMGGEIQSLVLISPHCCTYDEKQDIYTVNDYVNGINGIFEGDEVIHLRNITLDGGYNGVSTIAYAARSLGISANADVRTGESFKPGATMRGFVSGDSASGVRGFGDVQDDMLEKVSTRVTEDFMKGKTISYLHGNMKFNQLSISPADLQLLDTRKFGVLEICRFFGVHPDKVFAGQSTNYKASEMSNVSFLNDTLTPRLKQIEKAFTATLVGKQLFDKMKIEFDIEPIYQSDLTAMGGYMEKTIQNGVYTPNQWRAKKNFAPLEGGDQLFISCNVAPIDSDKIKGVVNDE